MYLKINISSCPFDHAILSGTYICHGESFQVLCILQVNAYVRKQTRAQNSNKLTLYHKIPNYTKETTFLFNKKECKTCRQKLHQTKPLSK